MNQAIEWNELDLYPKNKAEVKMIKEAIAVDAVRLDSLANNIGFTLKERAARMSHD